LALVDALYVDGVRIVQIPQEAVHARVQLLFRLSGLPVYPRQRKAADLLPRGVRKAQFDRLLAVVAGRQMQKHRDARRQTLALIAAGRAFWSAAAGDQPGLLRFEEVWSITGYLRRIQLLQELQVIEHPECASKGRDRH